MFSNLPVAPLDTGTSVVCVKMHRAAAAVPANGVDPMKTKKRIYLDACMRMPVEWLIQSASNPTRHMTQAHIALHWLAVRKKTVKWSIDHA